MVLPCSLWWVTGIRIDDPGKYCFKASLLSFVKPSLSVVHPHSQDIIFRGLRHRLGSFSLMVDTIIPISLSLALCNCGKCQSSFLISFLAVCNVQLKESKLPWGKNISVFQAYFSIWMNHGPSSLGRVKLKIFVSIVLWDC